VEICRFVIYKIIFSEGEFLLIELSDEINVMNKTYPVSPFNA